MAQIPKGGLIKDPYKPICRDCAIYFLITVTHLQKLEKTLQAVRFPAIRWVKKCRELCHVL